MKNSRTEKMKTKKTNEELISIIKELKLLSYKTNKSIWKSIALTLEKPTRKRRIVNVSRINRFCKDGELIIVPGKVLSSGSLNHKITVAAFSFSKQAIKKINDSGSKVMTLKELIKNQELINNTKNIRIIG
ncbi:MAG: 50S ribosomal protein L18e [Candidatus Woesearchaeota archaeon]